MGDNGMRTGRAKSVRFLYRSAADGDQPAVCLLHGLGGDENSMWAFSPALPAPWGIVAPRAPYRLDEGGYSWTRSRGRASLAEFESAVGWVVDFLPQAIASAGAGPDKIVLAGFSQGGALVLSALLRSLPALAGVVLAGFLPAGAEGSLGGLPIFWAHGRRDRDVPFLAAQGDAERLRRMGGQVEFCEADVDHRVGAACMRALSQWLHSLPVSPEHRPSDVP
jgi:phospholipase/carboxylesterase